MKELLDELNPEQQSAVLFHSGPQLILAGAGSGKTRVITYKIAYLIHEAICRPQEILGLTFTNKAAEEMKSRVTDLLHIPRHQLWISTFHSFANRVLQQEIHHHPDYRSHFVIYDEADKAAAIKTIIKIHQLDAGDSDPKTAAEAISQAKTRLVAPLDFCNEFSYRKNQLYQEIYLHYDELLRRNNALDFDDLLKVLIELFQSCPGILDDYQQRFRYILVDEYQDTNRPQYLIVKMLSHRHRNICVVGDDDQSIYSWRGADIRNILDFETDFPDAAIYKLERNYRSTQNILTAASTVVNCNKDRMSKTLWTEAGDGEPLTVFNAVDDHEEARFVVEQIYREVTFNYRAFSEIAIFYRTNAQSRILEEYCRRFQQPIPYSIIGGFRFYERKEVKDLLSYLCVVHNPDDSLSMQRVINNPKRGIGDSTIEKGMSLISDRLPSLYQVLSDPESSQSFSSGLRTKTRSFVSMIEHFHSIRHQVPIHQLLTDIDSESGYSQQYRNELTIENQSRLDNIDELINAAYEFEDRNPQAKLEDFLNQIRLQSDIDQMRIDQDQITMMTIHCAKGLEFPVVFICGLEEGLFPLRYNQNEIESLEEERRLFYVALTRSRQKVYMSYANTRRRFQDYYHNEPSRFLSELPQELLDFHS